jgi:hypothetical protein
MSYNPESSAPSSGDALKVVADGIDEANDTKKDKQTEYAQVKKLFNSYTVAQTFDRPARKQYAIDRNYAAGTADLSWAVTTNLIGSYIDILVSYLYARDPDVNVTPAEHICAPPPDKDALVEKELQSPLAAEATQAGVPPEMQQQLASAKVDADIAKQAKAYAVKEEEMRAFADTMQLVIPRLWKDSKLKKSIRKEVRSALSCGPGWIKAILLIDHGNPQVEEELNDIKDKISRIVALQKQIADGDVDDMDIAKAELIELQKGAEAKTEVAIKKGLVVDFCSAEDVQVSLDVRDLEEYQEADWIANSIYKPKDELAALFPELSDDDIKKATCYYQRKPKDYDKQVIDMPETQVTYKDAEQFSKEGNMGTEDGQPIEFAKIIEVWDRRDNMIKTIIDGVQCWAKPPFPPPMATSRFYPYFYLAFYPVDGSRHPQSLSWRLRKLQDEYSVGRSTMRLTRDRAVPGVLFDAEQIDPENARKLQDSKAQEFTGIKKTNPNAQFNTLFASKPVAAIDMALFNMEPVIRDMEKISAVQEAQQGAATPEKTATQSTIEQQGFSARSSSLRDNVEMLLDDLARYTAELAIQALDIKDAQRIAGSHAFWPHGMSIEDLLTLVDINIKAGTTGKPNTAADRQAWSTILPLIMQLIPQIMAARAQGQDELADAQEEVLRKTMEVMGDYEDIDRLLPKAAPKLPATLGMPPGGAPAMLPPGGPPTPGNGATPTAANQPTAPLPITH